MIEYLIAALIFLLIVTTIAYRSALNQNKHIRTAWQEDAERLRTTECRLDEEMIELKIDLNVVTNQLKTTASTLATLRSETLVSARNHTKEIKAARADAVKRAAAVDHGFSGENFAPLVQDQWNHKDFRHMGDPIDFIVFDGMERVRNRQSGAEVDEVVLLDIKTGKSALSTIQRRVRDAVVAGRVRFAVFNTDTQVLRTWPSND